MRHIKFIAILIGSSLLTTASGQSWIPSTFGIGGETDAVNISYTAGQPYVSEGNHLSGFENLLILPVDTLFSYKLGEITEKVVSHHTDCRFRFYWDGHPDAAYTYEVRNRLDTSLALTPEAQSAVFDYTPLITDLSFFEVEFIGIDATDTLTQLVLFTPVPDLNTEQELITYMKEMEYEDTILIRKSWIPGDEMNFTGNDTVLKVDIIGKTIIFEEGNIPFTYQNISNLEELNIYANKLVIRDTVHLPQTRVKIFCEELLFEDQGDVVSGFITTPRTPLSLMELNGLDGSDFHCYCKKMEAPGNHLRFYLNGGEGSPSLMIGTGLYSAPGGGGDAGNFYSNLNLRPYVRVDGGMYGEPTDWKKMPLGHKGEAGDLLFEKNLYKWLHPHAVRFMLQYTRECYIYGQEELVSSTCGKYINLMRSYKNTGAWNNDTVVRLDLEQLYFSFSAIEEQLAENLDYFGNPRGWAPLLSFEANLKNYQNEIEFAIRVLYLDYWISKKAETLEQKQEAAQLIKGKSIGEITALKEDYAEAYEAFGPAMTEFQSVCAKQDSLEIYYNQKIDFLIAEAEDNVANSFEGIMRRIGSIAGQICSCIPHPYAQAAGTGLSIAASFDYEDPLSTENWNTLSENLLGTVIEFGEVSDNTSSLAQSIDPASLGVAADRQGGENARMVLNNLSPEILQNLGSNMKEITISDDKVKAEFDRLKSECPILEVWTDSIESYTMKKGEVAQVMSFNQQLLTSIPMELTKMLLVCDAMDDIMLSNENVVDARAMSYLNEMKKTAWERMVRYHYYMAMAYQYRFLEPYPEPLNMRPLFESFDTIATHDADLSSDQYNALLPIFENQIKAISDEIYTSFNEGTYSEFNEPITYTLTDKQLRKLNTEGELRINIWNSGKIPRQNVDCRITDISIVREKLKISQDTILSDAALTIMMAHSGNSALIHPTSGKHFIFSQYNDDAALYYNTSSMSPLGWAEKYFFYSGEMSTIERSLASESLIRKILDVAGDTDLMIFTRPAGWSEIKLVTSLHTGEQANMNVTIDSLTLLVNIDYKPTTKFSNVLVSSSHDLLPLIKCSKPDLNEKTYGWGNFTRSFSRNTGEVTFTAPDEYGIYAFDKWKMTTSSGTEEISYKSVQVNTLDHTWISANFKLNVPDLQVTDTLYATWNQSAIDVDVKNLNVCDHLPMEWFSSSTCDWFSVKAGTGKGVENGKISLNLTSNPGEEREGIITVYAMDADNPEQQV
ncbi:MAG: BACON domain-containing carbohydrate-binding protein, partial [Bacteroidota bacterium]